MVERVRQSAVVPPSLDWTIKPQQLALAMLDSEAMGALRHVMKVTEPMPMDLLLHSHVELTDCGMGS